MTSTTQWWVPPDGAIQSWNATEGKWKWTSATNLSNVAYTLTPSNDITGNADYQNLGNIIAGLPLDTDGVPYGLITWGPGNYYYNQKTMIPYRVEGAGVGKSTRIWSMVATPGQAVFEQHGPFVGSTVDFMEIPIGGGLRNLCFDGSLAAAGTYGVDCGDCNGLVYDQLYFRHFTATLTIQCHCTNASGNVTLTSAGLFPPKIVTGWRVSGGTGQVTVPANTTVTGGAGTTTLSLSNPLTVTAGPLDSYLTFAPAVDGGGIGFYQRNYNQWTEKMRTDMMFLDNDIAVCFDVTANPYDSTTHGSPSHELGHHQWIVLQAAFQNGVLIQNGSSMGSCNVSLRGNYETSQTNLQAGGYYVMKVTGTVPTGHPSSGTVANGDFDDLVMSMTSTGGGGTAPYSLWVDAGCEIVTSIRGRYTNRLGDAFVNATGNLSLNGVIVGANTPNNARTTHFTDGLQTTTLGGTNGGIAYGFMFGDTAITGVTGDSTAHLKRFVVQLAAFNSGGAQHFNFGATYAATPRIVVDDSGAATASTTQLTFGNTGGAKTGWVIVEGW